MFHMSMPDSFQLPETIGKRVDPTYSKILQARLKELLNSQNDSFPGSQPVSFELKHFEDIQNEDYFVCEKSDGVRYLLFFVHSPKGPASFLFDRNRLWYYIPNLLFSLRNNDTEYLKDTLMDGELVLDIDKNKRSWRYLVFDLMVINGVNIMQRSFSTRLGMLQQDVIQPFSNKMKHNTDQSNHMPFTVELKRMERAYGLHLVFDQIPKLKHKSDGIIWTPVNYPYTPGTCEKLLKWKPPELNTVDFRIAARWSKEHKPMYSIEVLSNDVTYKFFDHFQPEPPQASDWKNHLPDGRIAEFRYDPQYEVTIVEQGYAPTIRKGGWRFVRFRDDKKIANDEVVVKKTISSIQDGVTKEQLLRYMDKVRSAWKAREKSLLMPSVSTKATDNTEHDTSSSCSPSTSAQSPVSTSRQNSISEDGPQSRRRSSNLSSILPAKKKSTDDACPDIGERKKIKPITKEEQPSTIPDTLENEHHVASKKEQQQSEKLESQINIRERAILSLQNQESQVLARPTDQIKQPKKEVQSIFQNENQKNPQTAVESKFQNTPHIDREIRGKRRKMELDNKNRLNSLETMEKTVISKQTIQDETYVARPIKESSPNPSKSNINYLLSASNQDTPTKLRHESTETFQSGPYQQARKQHSPQQRTAVQFINFHAEKRKNSGQENSNINNSNNNHVLIIRSESKSQLPPSTSPSEIQYMSKSNNDDHTSPTNSSINNPYPSNHPITTTGSPYHNIINKEPSFRQQQKRQLGQHNQGLTQLDRPQYQHSSLYSPSHSHSHIPATAYEQQRQPSLYDYPYQGQPQMIASPQQQLSQQYEETAPKRKNNQKAKLDFILN